MGANVSMGNQFDRIPIDSAGTEITLPLAAKQRMFVCTDDIDEAKEWVKSSVEATLFIPSIRFKIVDDLWPQTFPADFYMSDALWDDGTKVWTPEDLGEYEASVTYDGTRYTLRIIGPIS